MTQIQTQKYTMTEMQTHTKTEIDIHTHTDTHTNPKMQTTQLTYLSLVSHTATESWETGFSLVAFDARWAR